RGITVTMATAYFIVTVLTTLVGPGLGHDGDLRVREQHLGDTANDFVDVLKSLGFATRNSKYYQTTKCIVKCGWCQKKGTCPYTHSIGCARGCDCCLPQCEALSPPGFWYPISNYGPSCPAGSKPTWIRVYGYICCQDRSEGCLFGDTIYLNGASIEGSCMDLQCVNGSWKFTDTIDHACGHCSIEGGPQITTYVPNSNNPEDLYARYSYSGDGEYILTQPGLYGALFGVNVNFTACDYYGNYTCITGLTYYEPGIYITLENTTPLEAIKVYVNYEERTIDDYSVSIFFGTDGAVLVFKSFGIESLPGDHPLDCINIVGTKGLSVNYCQNEDYYDSVWVWSLPSLKSEPTAEFYQTSGQLYGLCDQYTISGDKLPYYTMRNGTQYYGIPALFADTWQVYK
ncbi:unnamed protein product, partial [Meganyctiphanes norvegica]